jgi:membrane protein DedA with SNARE-associated domain
MFSFFTSLFQSLFSFLLLYKYFGLFFIALISSIAIPIPTSVALSAAGAFASQGYLNIYAVLSVTLLGSIIGDMTGYILARKYGEKILGKIVFFRHLMNSFAYHKIENYISDFSPSLIFFSRFLTELSPVTNLLAGLSDVSYKSFFIFALLGETAYTILYGMAGFFLGSQWENNISFIAKAGLIMISLGVTVNLIQVLLYKRRRITKSPPSDR